MEIQNSKKYKQIFTDIDDLFLDRAELMTSFNKGTLRGIIVNEWDDTGLLCLMYTYRG